MKHWLVISALMASLYGSALAVPPSERLDDPALEAKARKISKELRCLVCQNQSIDDSDAELAKDLQRIVRERLKAGDDEAAIKDYVVARYGEFVLLKPRFNRGTALLWGSPLLLVLLGIGFASYSLRRRSDPALSPHETQTDNGAESPMLSDDAKAVLDKLRRD